jgi:hypothetical protein
MIDYELRDNKGRENNCRNRNRFTESYVLLVQSLLSYCKAGVCKIQPQKHRYNAKNIHVLAVD